jgi:hypothetical protein
MLGEEERRGNTIAEGQVLLYIYFLLPTEIPNHNNHKTLNHITTNGNT